MKRVIQGEDTKDTLQQLVDASYQRKWRVTDAITHDSSRQLIRVTVED